MGGKSGKGGLGPQKGALAGVFLGREGGLSPPKSGKHPLGKKGNRWRGDGGTLSDGGKNQNKKKKLLSVGGRKGAKRGIYPPFYL